MDDVAFNAAMKLLEALGKIDDRLAGIEKALDVISTVLSRCEGYDDRNKRFIRTYDLGRLE